MKYALLLIVPVAFLTMGSQDAVPAPAASPIVDAAKDFLGIDEETWKQFGNYALVAAITMAVVEFLKKVIKRGPIDGHEPMFSIAIAPLAGAVLKLTGAAHGADPWLPHLVTCAVLGAILAKVIHDQYWTPIMGFIKHVLAKSK